MNSLFSYDGPVMTVLNTLTSLVVLNILTVVFSIPVITAGASFSAAHYCLIQIREGTEGKTVSTFWAQWKNNLKSATPVWLILLAAAVILYIDNRVITASDRLPGALRIPVLIVAIAAAGIAVFVFPLIAKFENTWLMHLKNAAILALANLPRTIAMIAIFFLCIYFLSTVGQLLPLFFLMGFSLPAYLSSFLYWPVLKKLIDGQKGEETDSEEEL